MRMHNVMPTVFVVDDDASVRKALQLLIKSVGLNAETFDSGHEFLRNYSPEMRGCLILDLRMPKLSGLELQDELLKQGIDIPVVFITGHGDVSVAVQALKKGAVDFVEKPFSDQLLLDAVQRAIIQDEQRRERRAKIEDIEERLQTLTSREREVMQLVVAGKVSKLIASELHISKKTVEVHRSHIMKKLGAKCVADLVRMVLGASVIPEQDNDPFDKETRGSFPSERNRENVLCAEPILA